MVILYFIDYVKIVIMVVFKFEWLVFVMNGGGVLFFLFIMLVGFVLFWYLCLFKL